MRTIGINHHGDRVRSYLGLVSAVGVALPGGGNKEWIPGRARNDRGVKKEINPSGAKGAKRER